MPASTVTEYLAALPAERRDALNEVRRGINRALPPGYQEGIQFGMISWFVPLSTYPAGYGGNPRQPLPLISLASQKSYMALHMICFYGQPALLEWFNAQYAKERQEAGHGRRAASVSRRCRTSRWMWLRAPWPGSRSRNTSLAIRLCVIRDEAK